MSCLLYVDWALIGCWSGRLLIFLFVWALYKLCSLLFTRDVNVDRMLAKGEFKMLGYLFAVVMLVLFTVWSLSSWIGLTGEDIMNSREHNLNLFWAILYHCTDPGNQNMAEGGVPRAIALLIAVFGVVFLNGVLISSIVNLFERHIAKWEQGLARYPKVLAKSNYIVIIGSNDLIPDLIRQIFQREQPLDYILVQTNADVEKFRKYLASFLSAEDEKRVIIYAGEQTSTEDVADLLPEYAKEVFILGDTAEAEDDKNSTNHDAMNMRCLQIIADRLAVNKSKQKLICRVMFEYQTSFSIFQYANISNEIEGNIDFRPFNYYEMWAQRVFVNRTLEFKAEHHNEYLPLEGEKPIPYESDATVHLVVVGMSKMGVAMAIETAHLAHYPNFDRNSKLKTRITFIDHECDKQMEFFKGRFKEMFALSQWRYMDSSEGEKFYKEKAWENSDYFERHTHLGEDFVDVQWEFIKGGIENKAVHSYLKDAVGNSNVRFNLAICLPQDNQSVAGAIYLPDEVYANAVQVLVYQRYSGSIINSIALDNKMNMYYRQLKPFGMLSTAYDDKLVEDSHRASMVLDGKYWDMMQEVNKELSIYESKTPGSRGKSKAAKYWSNIYNANTIWGKLRSIGYTDDKGKTPIDDKFIQQLAHTEHNRWSMEQLLMRFRVLTEEEQKSASIVKGNNNEEEQKKAIDEKARLKGDLMAHLDICSCDRLPDIDYISVRYDAGFIKIIPEILCVLAKSAEPTTDQTNKK